MLYNPSQRHSLFTWLLLGVLLSGWLFTALLVWQFRERLLFRVDSLFLSYQRDALWEQLIQTRKSGLRQVAWADERPLILMLGDSQIEMGSWYDLFKGRFAIRNAGLSQARVKDISRIAEETPQIRPALVVLQGGINDLSSGRSANETLSDFAEMMIQLQTGIAKDRILVMSVIPVATTRLGDGSADLNLRVREFNSLLHQHCLKLGIAFFDPSPALSTDGVLKSELTWDGLHLNPQGYHQLSHSMEPQFTELYGKSERP